MSNDYPHKIQLPEYEKAIQRKFNLNSDILVSRIKPKKVTLYQKHCKGTIPPVL